MTLIISKNKEIAQKMALAALVLYNMSLLIASLYIFLLIRIFRTASGKLILNFEYWINQLIYAKWYAFLKKLHANKWQKPEPKFKAALGFLHSTFIELLK